MPAYHFRRTTKYFVIALLVLITGIVSTGILLSRPLPQTIPGSGQAADSLALEMLNAVNAEAWKNTPFVSWDFGSRHSFDWNRENDRVVVRWKNYKAEFSSSDHLSGKAWQKEQALDGEKKERVLEEAWRHFCNDSFWLAAPFKVFDEGTSRALVDLGDGNRGLLVTYASGGVTPGDSYLWLLDEENRPVAWRMWVDIIPVGGLKASWESYETLDSGARISTAHKMLFFRLKLKVTDQSL